MCFVFGLLPPDLGMRVMLSRERQQAMASLSWPKCEVGCPLPRSSAAQKHFLTAGFGALLSSYNCLLRWKSIKSLWGVRSHTQLFLHQREGHFNTFRHLTWSQGSSLKLLHVKSEISCAIPHPPKNPYTQVQPRSTALSKRGEKKHLFRR